MVAELSEQQYRPHPNRPPATGGGDESRKRNVRRTALWLALLAAAFYLGFIGLSVLRSH